MKKKKEAVTSQQEPKENVSELKKEISKSTVKKGYNENNPTQPAGAFKPDAMHEKR